MNNYITIICLMQTNKGLTIQYNDKGSLEHWFCYSN